jgi:hypothetical protein
MAIGELIGLAKLSPVAIRQAADAAIFLAVVDFL